ncbi:MAG: hypothetical protein ACLUKN_00050 [Bacilli bacterium]
MAADTSNILRRIIFQTLACFAGIVLGGVRCRDAYLAAINKAQIGEFSFVIATLISSGVMSPSIMVIAMGVSFVTVFANPFLAARSEAVMGFARATVPKKILEALDIYRSSVESVSRSAAENRNLRAFIPHIGAILVYTLMFSAVMFVSAYIAGIIESESTPYPEWLAIGIWIAAAALSLPMLAGTLRNSGKCAAGIVDALESKAAFLKGENARLHSFLRGVFVFYNGGFRGGIFRVCF